MCLAILRLLPLHRQQNLSWPQTSLFPRGITWECCNGEYLELTELKGLLYCTFSTVFPPSKSNSILRLLGSSLQTPVHTKHQGRLEQPLGQSGSNISRLNFLRAARHKTPV
jgi:hypothetical protein